MIWRHHPVCHLHTRLRGGISSCSALGRPWLGTGTTLGLRGISKAKRAGDTLAGVGGSQGKQGEAMRARISQPERRRRQRGIQWPLLLLRDILGSLGMGSARKGTAASGEAPASPEETILILTNSLLTPCLRKSASSQPLPCCKLSPEHWQSHSLLFSQDFSMLLAE